KAKPIGDGSGGGGSGRAREHRDSESSTDPQHRDQAQAASQPDDRRSPRSSAPICQSRAAVRPLTADVYVTLEKLMEAQEAFNNLVLAHEVATNDNFRFEPPPPSASEASLRLVARRRRCRQRHPRRSSSVGSRDTMHRAFWDVLTENLAKTPPDYSQAVMTLIARFKTILLSLLPNNERARQQIEEVLDLELIRQKVEHGAFDINYYSNYVLDLMGKMCAPARDEAIRACAAIQEPVALFRELFRLLEPDEAGHGQLHYAADAPLYSTAGCDLREREIRTALMGFAGLELGCPSRPLPCQPLNERPAAVVSEALLRLVDWRQSRPQPEADWWPETLVMDAQKLVGIRDRLAQLHCVCACVLLAMGRAGPAAARRSEAGARATAAAAAVLADCPADRLDSAAAGLADTLAKIGRIGRLPGVNDKECQLLTAQLADPAAVHATGRPPAAQPPDGLPTRGPPRLAGQAGEVAGGFACGCAPHNRAVFGQLYDKLLILPDGRAGQAVLRGRKSRGEEQGWQLILLRHLVFAQLVVYRDSDNKTPCLTSVVLAASLQIITSAPRVK
uniref:MIF4G domain-containing protein n=1 Tax=Macrostomum lignano TaxID=282301 RepID=A0A1I8F890_9PLAT